MNADRLARLCRIASGGAAASLAHGVTVTPVVTPKKPAVAPVTPVTPFVRGKGKGGQTSAAIHGSGGPDLAEIEERAGIASDSVPAPFVDAWARLVCQKPAQVSEAAWRLALDDAGRFLDDWGDEAAAMQWSAGELFDIPCERQPGGIVWQSKGERVAALVADRVRLSDGRVIARGGVQGDETKIGN